MCSAFITAARQILRTSSGRQTEPRCSLRPLALIVNGFPVATQEISSDGVEQSLSFEHSIETSSWAAIRVFPGAHTNPVFVMVDDKPIRASRLSAQWCLKSVEQCWKAKAHTYRADERATAEVDYETAKDVFRSIVEESR